MSERVVLTPNLVHYGKIVDENGRFIRWIPNPKNNGKRTKTSKYEIKDVMEFHNFKEPFCFFCLRRRDQLGVKETLTIDHIKELEEGGKDELENLQILCTACHKLKNWTRLYMNWHLRDKNE